MHLNELNLNKHERRGYQFSVLLEEFDGILHFTVNLKVKVHKLMLS